MLQSKVLWSFQSLSPQHQGYALFTINLTTNPRGLATWRAVFAKSDIEFMRLLLMDR